MPPRRRSPRLRSWRRECGRSRQKSVAFQKECRSHPVPHGLQTRPASGFVRGAHNGIGLRPRKGWAPLGVEENESIAVAQPFDRARLETADDDDSGFPPAEPTSFSPRPSGRPSDDIEHGFFSSQPASLAPFVPSLPVAPPRIVSPARAAFAKRLFATLFGGLALLVGYVLLHVIG